jgi:hypothetical protein
VQGTDLALVAKTASENESSYSSKKHLHIGFVCFAHEVVWLLVHSFHDLCLVELPSCSVMYMISIAKLKKCHVKSNKGAI